MKQGGRRYLYVIEVGMGTRYGPFGSAKEAEKWLAKTYEGPVIWSLHPLINPNDRGDE